MQKNNSLDCKHIKNIYTPRTFDEKYVSELYIERHVERFNP